MNKFDGVRIFSFDLDRGFLGTGMAIIMNNSLACHVSKIEEISGYLVFVWLFFKGKLSVVILGLYTDASAKTKFGQAYKINSIIAKTTNSSTFMILGGDFNEDGFRKSASFKFCSDLGLVNSFSKYSLVKASTWGNSWGVMKIIDYIFVSRNLSSILAGYEVASVSDFFNTDYNAVLVSVGLDGFLDVQLNNECKQANKNKWKFKIKDVDANKWTHFREHSLSKFLEYIDMFNAVKDTKNLDTMWEIFREVVISSTDNLVKYLSSDQESEAVCFFKMWSTFDNKGASKACTMFDNNKGRESILQHLSRVKKLYRKSKYYESRVVRDILIRKTINKYMKTFSSNKKHMIKSVLEWPFKKVVLDHLIVNDKLILKPKKVLFAVASISMPVCWSNQYASLDYVSDNTFSNVMSVIGLDEFLMVVKKLPDGKAVSILGIPNELWKHGDAQILSGLLDILNMCLKLGVPYDWEETLTNTKPIALVEMARKILFKVFSDRIFLTYSKFNVLHEDNFSVLKGTSAQTLIFTIGSVIEDMCTYFIEFFGNIYNDWTNWVIMDFGFTDRYTVKKHEQLCRYRLDSKFFTRTGRADPKDGKTSFFAAGVFVNNTIWVGNCLAVTQHILDIVSKFFLINDIAINTDKMVAISINQEARSASLFISGSEISIAKKGEFHQYLGIFLLWMAYIRFFSNVVLRKAITEKQFLYLVSAILQSIVNYKLQFSCVSKSSLKLKANLPKNFPNKALYYPELYGLKTFKQVLAENLLAGLVMFANANKIFSELFEHRAIELQTISWMLWHPLKFPIKLLVNSMNCFLAGTTRVFKLCNLLLGGNLPDVFWARNSIAVLNVLGFESYLGIAKSLRRYSMVFMDQLLNCHSKCFTWNTFYRWKKLNPRGLIPVWFTSLVKFIVEGKLSNGVLLSPCSISTDSLCDFGYVDKHLLNSGLGSITIYTNGSVKNLGLVQACSGTVTYFLDVDTSVGVKVNGLLSSTLVELQTIALALKCALLDLCKFVYSIAGLDFHDKCWIKKEHIHCVIFKKNLLVTWIKVKGHSGIIGNKPANFYTDAVIISESFLPLVVSYCFFNVEGRPVSRNTYHVAKKLFNAVYSVGWEARCIGSIINVSLYDCFDKAKTFCIKSGYTNTASVTLWSYFIKVLYHHLPVAKRKKMYNPNYPIENSDHIFSCSYDINVQDILLSDTALEWNVLLGTSANGNTVTNLLNKAAASMDLFIVLAKDFVLKNWVVDMLDYLGAKSGKGALVVDFIYCFAKSHRSAVWLPVVKLRTYYKKFNLLLHDGFSISLVSSLSFLWFAEMIWNFGFRISIHVCFGLYLCLASSDFGFLHNFSVVKNLDM
ncbi:hypothetical protein G9A89_015947 [Geosiphon pyriformis]|nr:hypothetical protein G9A89_015947 [Geosiphon pyriformis]